MYKGKRLPIKSKEERQQVIHDIHEGIGNQSVGITSGRHLKSTEGNGYVNI